MLADWTPIFGTLTGAFAALAGTWVSHKLNAQRDRRARLAGKIEEIACLAFSLREKLLARLVAAGEGVDLKDYPGEVDRLHVLVHLHAPKALEGLDAFLDVAIRYDQLIDKAAEVIQSGVSVDSIATDQSQILTDSSNAPRDIFDAAVDFVDILRDHYRQDL